MFAAFLRSPHAHANILSTDLGPARARPGVIAAYDGAALLRWCRPIRATIAVPGLIATDWPVIAVDRVRFVGEAVAVVIATSPAAANDALEYIEVEYEQLRPITDVTMAALPDAPLIHLDAQTNVLFQKSLESGDVKAAFANADLIVSEKFHTQRATGVPIETRGYLAQPDKRSDRLILWSSTQVPHIIRSGLVDVLGIKENSIRVIAPDVGGGFGVKGQLFPEEAVVCALARELQGPVKWIESRQENLLASIHSREHNYEVEAAVSREGRLLAIRAKVTVDAGAYSVYPYTISTEPTHSASILPGPYELEAYACEALGVATNKCPIAPYRGVSRPPANFVIERLMDIIARRLALDPAEFRLRNLIPDNRFPYQTASGMVLDSGQYSTALRRVLSAVNYDRVREDQAAKWSRGQYIGVGISFFIESSAGGSASFVARGMPVAGFDMARVRVLPTARVEVFTSAASQGQGHETVFAQLAAKALNLPAKHIEVFGGDTQYVPFGTGTFGSRSAVMSGGAVTLAAKEVRKRAEQLAAHLLEVSQDDVTLDESGFRVTGTDKLLSWSDVASAAHLGTDRLPSDISRGLEAMAAYDLPAGHTPCSYGVHIAVVEVDPETGVFSILRYVVVEDCGTVLNAQIVEGQIHGAFAQGLGAAKLESLVYDEHGQLLSGSLMDYAVPRAVDVPNIEIEHLSTLSPYTIDGAKGMAEGASVAPPAALSNAICDALRPLRTEIFVLPLTSERIWRSIVDSKRSESP